jgi:hypothetical protein
MPKAFLDGHQYYCVHGLKKKHLVSETIWCGGPWRWEMDDKEAESVSAYYIELHRKLISGR